MANLCLLTVAEARAILIADDALALSFVVREECGRTFGIEEREAWAKLVESAYARIATYEGTKHEPSKDLVIEPYPGGNEPDFQTLFMEAVMQCREARTGYTGTRLTADDAAHVAELLRVSIEDKHWIAWHPRLREIREKMIERMSDIVDQRGAP